MADIVSERYALSLYEIAVTEKQEREYLDELSAVREVFKKEPEFLKVLKTPSISMENKKKVLESVFGGKLSSYILNFLMLITEKNRIGLFADMAEAYKERYYFSNNIIEVQAVTSATLSDDLAEKLRKKMCTVTGKDVVLKKTVDKSLLGGIVLKVNNKQFDTSLRTKLSEIAQNLTNTIA